MPGKHLGVNHEFIHVIDICIVFLHVSFLVEAQVLSKEEKDKLRRKELKNIKRKFGLEVCSDLMKV